MWAPGFDRGSPIRRGAIDIGVAISLVQWSTR